MEKFVIIRKCPLLLLVHLLQHKRQM